MRSAPKSFLYVPGDRADFMAKASAGAADAIILDLEDGVAPASKPRAQEVAREFLRREVLHKDVWLRVEGDRCVEQIDAMMLEALSGVMVPGAVPGRLASADAALTRAEQRLGVAERHFGMIALVETARGVEEVAQLFRTGRSVRLALGEADLAADLGLHPDDQQTELWPIRSTIVVASAAAGAPGPLGPVETRLDDQDHLRETSERQRRQGFVARTAIHPQQLSVINAVFSPSRHEIAEARDLVACYETAVQEGRGAVRGPDGRMLDVATVRAARRLLSSAGCEPGSAEGS